MYQCPIAMEFEAKRHSYNSRRMITLERAATTSVVTKWVSAESTPSFAGGANSDNLARRVTSLLDPVQPPTGSPVCRR